MLIISKGKRAYGEQIVEFHSEGNTHTIRSYYLQFPSQINSDDFFEIPNEFMQKEIGLTRDQNPVAWYKEKTKDNPTESNIIFEKFMDAVARFCKYDRRGKMEKRQKWYENNFE